MPNSRGEDQSAGASPMFTTMALKVDTLLGARIGAGSLGDSRQASGRHVYVVKV